MLRVMTPDNDILNAAGLHLQRMSLLPLVLASP